MSEKQPTVEQEKTFLDYLLRLTDEELLALLSKRSLELRWGFLPDNLSIGQIKTLLQQRRDKLDQPFN